MLSLVDLWLRGNGVFVVAVISPNDGISCVDGKTKKDKVVDLSVWPRSEVELKYFVYVAEMKDNKLCFDHHHI